MAVIDITPKGFTLREIAKGVEVGQVVAATDAPLSLPEGDIPVF